MYQVNTFYPLASSKQYFDNKKDIFFHLRQVVKKTNEAFRAQNRDPVHKEEIEEGCKILKLDIEENPDVMNFLGRGRVISDHNLTGAQPPEDYKDLFSPIVDAGANNDKEKVLQKKS